MPVWSHQYVQQPWGEIGWLSALGLITIQNGPKMIWSWFLVQHCTGMLSNTHGPIRDVGKAWYMLVGGLPTRAPLTQTCKVQWLSLDYPDCAMATNNGPCFDVGRGTVPAMILMLYTQNVCRGEDTLGLHQEIEDAEHGADWGEMAGPNNGFRDM